MKTPTQKAPTLLLALALLAVGGAKAAGATALNALIDTRPLTPQNLKDYALPAGTQGASGLATVPIGQPVYLEALLNIAIAPADIVSVTWTLANQPLGSLVGLSASPLGANVPPYKPSDRSVLQVGGRTVLVPDVVGQYMVTATIVTTASGTTNVTREITAGTYMGVNTCALCHSGGLIAPNKVEPWSHTRHATKFERGIEGEEGASYGKNCISCHTVGYNANTNAVNGGFDDVAAQLGWTFPTVLSPTNYAAVPDDLKNLANIQCENCHGPGSQHAFSLGNTNRISVSYNVGNCAQCHDSGTHHFRVAEWNNSGHAVAPRIAGAGREACMQCHNAQGFKNYANGAPAVGLPYEPISCATCHDPHDATNPHQLRTPLAYTLADGTSVTNAGYGAFCMNCHHTRNGPAATNIENYQLGRRTWTGGSSFGTHHSSQGDMLEGVNAIDYGLAIPSSAHRFAVTNTCVGCHMQSVASSNPAFTKAGGHTFNLTYSNGTDTVDLVDACVNCHGPIQSFDMPKEDFNGDGIVEGVQTEVRHLLDKLSTMLPNATYLSNANYVADGTVKASLTVRTNWPTKFLKAAYNWQFVREDGSFGVHNAFYAVGLLKASIADLTGDANNDGLADAWQAQYFGSASNPDAAPNANPAGDGIPNWLKFSLGLDPTKPGTTMPGGVVWASGKDLVNPPIDPNATNTLVIYTAAEISFNTEAGKTYQLQSIASMTDGWQNVGSPIAGTGAPVSYVTPTRANTQQFYRVVTTQ